MLTLTKKLFYENRDLNLIREMKVGKFGMDKTGLMVVGGSGACLLTLEGQPVRYITYKSLNLSSVQVIELPKQNTYAFVAGGLWGGPAAVVMDSEGKVKWRYDAKFKAMGAPAVIDLGASDDRKFQRVASWDAPHPYPGTSYLSLVAAEPLGPPNQRSGLVSLFTGTGSWRKTPLFVHSWEGRLIYEELPEDDYLSVLPLLSAEQGTVSFLVGGRGRVWRYSSSAR